MALYIFSMSCNRKHCPTFEGDNFSVFSKTVHKDLMYKKKDECALWIHELYKFKSNLNNEYIDSKILGPSNIIIHNNICWNLCGKDIHDSIEKELLLFI